MTAAVSSLNTIPWGLERPPQGRFDGFVICGPEKPERDALSCLGGAVNEIVQAAVGLLAAFEAVPGRDVAVASVEPDREIGAFADVPDLIVNGEHIDAAALECICDRELAKRALPVGIEGQIARVSIAVLRHEDLQGAVSIARRRDVADVPEFVTGNHRHGAGIGA